MTKIYFPRLTTEGIILPVTGQKQNKSKAENVAKPLSYSLERLMKTPVSQQLPKLRSHKLMLTRGILGNMLPKE
jgi:hypothetical protein